MYFWFFEGFGRKKGIDCCGINVTKFDYVA